MASYGENTAGGPGAAPGPTIAQGPAQLDAGLDAGLDGGPALTELRYDRDAIRRGIAQVFTPGELSRFAQRFKVFTDREGSAARGAAQLVRAIDTRGELRKLAEALMREKPEHDWPAPTLAPVKPAQAVPAERGAVSDPFAPPPEPAAKPGAVKLSEPPAAVDQTRPAAPSGGLDGRRATLIAALVFGGGLALGIGATLVATLRGSADGEEAKSPRGPAALAMIATEELAKSVDYVSTTCELDERDANVREQLAEAFRRCAVTDIQPSPPATTPTAAPPPTAAAPKPRRPTRERSIPLRKASPAARCLDKCHGVHQQCVKMECGPEPSSANQYPDYQRCTSRCMTRYSRCRLSCR